VRLAVIAILVVALAGCAESALTSTEYSDLLSERSAAFALEAEELRSTQLFGLERAVDDLVKELAGGELEAAVIAETGRSSASLFASTADAVGRYASDLAAIEPPAAMLAPHLEFVDALRLSITGVGATIQALAGASSFDQIEAAIGGSTFNDTQYRVDTACRNLEMAMTIEGMTVDLQCRDR